MISLKSVKINLEAEKIQVDMSVIYWIAVY